MEEYARHALRNVRNVQTEPNFVSCVLMDISKAMWMANALLRVGRESMVIEWIWSAEDADNPA